MERIALGQMRTKGKVSLEEINQLTESGVDAMRILSEATGLTGKALTDSISKGLERGRRHQCHHCRHGKAIRGAGMHRREHVRPVVHR